MRRPRSLSSFMFWTSGSPLKGGKYDYITKLAVKCSAKRLYPDYISAKKMREHYEGNVFSPMGCRSCPRAGAEGRKRPL